MFNRKRARYVDGETLEPLLSAHYYYPYSDPQRNARAERGLNVHVAKVGGGELRALEG